MIDLKMLDPKNVEELKLYRQSLINRGIEPDVLDQLADLNQKRKDSLTESQSVKAEINRLSSEVGTLKREGKDTSSLLTTLENIKTKFKELDKVSKEAEETINKILMILPNKPHESVPVGTSEKDNLEVSVVGDKPQLNFKPKEHFELGENLGVIDFERARKVTGARFAFLKGAAAQMERSLIQLMMDLHSTQNGYTEMIPPFIVNSQSLVGTGQFPKFKEDVFGLAGTDYYLIPTAEVPVTNYYSNEILAESDLPKSFCAYSPCFRSEAGSAGRDTKGLIRQHQFDKVELMTFCHPSQSYEVHEKLTTHAESILKALELPYRKVLLCTRDMGFGSAKTYDLEVWLPGQNTYREISSCSNFEDFQARRANIRFKPEDGGKPQFVHTLNGSGLAVGRTLVAIFENYQNEDGSISIPKALQPYMGGKTKI